VINPDEPSPLRSDDAAAGLVYEGSPKHKEPSQPGARGSLCPREITPAEALRLLHTSLRHGEKRFAIASGGRPFAAKQHQPGRWHGWPIGWMEVPDAIRPQLQKAFGISNREKSRHWQRTS